MTNSIESTTTTINNKELFFEIEKKGDFCSYIRVCERSTGHVSIYLFNKDHEWDVYDMYSQYGIKNYVLENQDFFFRK